MEAFIQAIPTFTSIGVFVFGVAWFVIQWKKGGNTASEETLDLREKQVAAFKEQIRLIEDRAVQSAKESKERELRFNQEIKELTGKIGELTGLLQAREKENKELREIILNRNPEVEVFYKNAMQYFSESKPVIDGMKQFMEEMKKYITENTNELHTQTKELKHQSEVLEQIK